MNHVKPECVCYSVLNHQFKMSADRLGAHPAPLASPCYPLHSTMVYNMAHALQSSNKRKCECKWSEGAPRARAAKDRDFPALACLLHIRAATTASPGFRRRRRSPAPSRRSASAPLGPTVPPRERNRARERLCMRGKTREDGKGRGLEN